MLSLKDIFGNQLPVNPKIVESYLSAKDTKSVNDVRERNSLFFGNTCEDRLIKNLKRSFV